MKIIHITTSGMISLFHTILSNFVPIFQNGPRFMTRGIIKMNYYATTLSCKYFHITASEHMGRFGASCTYFHNHTSCRQNIMQENWEGGLNDQWFFRLKMMVKSCAIEIVFKSLVPFRIYQLISTANPALFDWKLAGLAGLID